MTDADLVLRFVAKALVLPPGGPLLVAVAGLALLRRAPRTGRACAWAGVLAIYLCSTPLLADGLIALVERYPPLDPAQAHTAAAIVVLGGGVRSGPAGGEATVLTPETLERLAAGAGLARATGLPLLLSGGAVSGRPPEALVMRAALERDFGLEPRWLETSSRTTRENARETARLLVAEQIRRVVLVTSAGHMWRAVGEFEAAGLTSVPAPVGGTRYRPHWTDSWLPDARALARSREALYEVGGLLVARLDGGR